MKFLILINIINIFLIAVCVDIKILKMSTFNCWMCRHLNVSQSKDKILINSIINENNKLECPICYDAFDSNNLFFTECKHYACYKCINCIIKKNIDDRSSRRLLIIDDQSIIDDKSIQIPLIIDDQHTRGRLVLHNNFNLTQVVVNNNSSRVPILIYIISIIYIFMIVYVLVNQ